jgi:hypothetical protein
MAIVLSKDPVNVARRKRYASNLLVNREKNRIIPGGIPPGVGREEPGGLEYLSKEMAKKTRVKEGKGS